MYVEPRNLETATLPGSKRGNAVTFPPHFVREDYRDGKFAIALTPHFTCGRPLVGSCSISQSKT
jgi:hypothetical protein